MFLNVYPFFCVGVNDDDDDGDDGDDDDGDDDGGDDDDDADQVLETRVA